MKYNNAKIMCVGDDYQSIYRFAGSDIELFLNFKKYFKDSEIMYLKNTYRNSKELLYISNNFICKNKYQFKKELFSNKSNSKPIKIYFCSNKIKGLKKLIRLCKENYMIIGRNNIDIKYYVEKGIDINNANYFTVHKSKGLEFSLCYFTGMHNEFTIKEINDKILISDKGGIILPYINENGDISQNILKDLYVDNFFKEEISEKIRLFYVALTRCREKMIIVTSLNKEKNGYGRLVPVNMRLKYRSFLYILNSIDIIDKYVVNKEANYTHDYDTIKLKEITKHTDGEVIDKKEIKINYEVGENKHFSKESDILYIDSVKAMKYGTLIHEELEYADFDKKNNKYLEKLFNVISSDYINVYREYEFSYQENNIVYNGVIDLMLEYDDYINIIDYKLKNIMDEKYNLQLRGYKKYIESISNKVVNIYLYSLIEDKILKIED